MSRISRFSLLLALAIVIMALASSYAEAQSTPLQQSEIAPSARESAIDGILEELDKSYVFPEKAAQMRKSIAARRAKGEYAAITNGAELATTLTRDLQDVSHDKHLRVSFTRGGQGPQPIRITPANRDSFARAMNYGVGNVELLPGNIGYVELRSFGFPAKMMEDAVTKAMTTVADADALIIDIRRNGGGSPDAVQLVSSYLFGEEPVHLNSLYFRPTNRTDDFYTLRQVNGKRFGPQKPVYVLTSNRTFSAAEEFAYNLQSRKRATIVGETTGGGAHPGGTERIGDFIVFVPSGRAINPITKTNWEGTGIRPEIAVPADSALAAALAHARSLKAKA